MNKVTNISKQTDKIGPSLRMLGPIESGTTLVCYTAPGCWGPMITPSVGAGHEVTWPLEVKGAEAGDVLALHVKGIEIMSEASCSGVHELIPERYNKNPFSESLCPGCGILNPGTHVEGTGTDAIKCDNCGAAAAPFNMTYGFTMLFDENKTMGLTVSKGAAQDIAKQYSNYAGLPKEARQHSSLHIAAADISGLPARCRPFVGNIGTVPEIDMPSNSNAGDSIRRLAMEHFKGVQDNGGLGEACTDSHVDSPRLREGSILLAPVKIKGGGVFVGDVHGMQGDGELAGHTTDVSAKVTITVHLIKALSIKGPILLPSKEDIPFLAKPFSMEEMERVNEIAHRIGDAEIDDTFYPISVIGTGDNLNDAIQCAVERAAFFTGMGTEEVLVRATITGTTYICRLPGVVEICFLIPVSVIKNKRLLNLFQLHYNNGIFKG